MGRIGVWGALSPGGKVSVGALDNFKSSPPEGEFEFSVDTGAERTCVCRIPKGCKKRQNTIQLVGAKGEGFKAPALKHVMFEGTNQIGMGDVLLVRGAGCYLPGRDLQVQLGIGVLPEDRKWK